jgi:hypothetical protein
MTEQTKKDELPAPTLLVGVDEPLSSNGILYSGRVGYLQLHRYFVACNEMEDGNEALRVLTAYYDLIADADEARRELTPEYPNCRVLATVSLIDVSDPAQTHAIHSLFRGYDLGNAPRVN